jgi:ribosomal-protein-alanine N-acetyltransferase
VDNPRPEWTIRLMNLGDIDSVCEIERDVFSDPWAPEVFEGELANPAASYICGVSPASGGVCPASGGVCPASGGVCPASGGDEEVLGYAGGWKVRGELHITNLAVRRSKQRRGIGQMLLATLERDALAQGCKIAYLEVRQGNLAAQSFYRQQGYILAYIRPNYYVKPREDALVLKKQLR